MVYSPKNELYLKKKKTSMIVKPIQVPARIKRGKVSSPPDNFSEVGI